MHILHVVGARPNFIKAAPVVRALSEYSSVSQTIVHTGQHYDANMSDVFFRQLAIPAPDVNLRVGSASHTQQTAEIMSRFEPVVLERKPDLVLVYGDVNSTVAAALVCAKLLVKVGHVEAGLRSFDRTMPEEINRLLTDQVSDLLFTPSKDGDENLAREGIAPEKIHFVGNVMIDTLVRMLPIARQQIPKELPQRFVLVTLHRPSNVDDLPWLAQVTTTLRQITRDLPVVFPVHPRTRKKLADAGLKPDGLCMIDPLPYIEFLGAQTRAALVITDSGGIQEETTFLGVPCITVRENTERPITIQMGTNHLVGRNVQKIRLAAQNILQGAKKDATIPPLWDGHAAERIASVIVSGRFTVNGQASRVAASNR
jgi:UDP-N-acetylglucosamine 2-epimerase (non-hydrolysing)